MSAESELDEITELVRKALALDGWETEFNNHGLVYLQNTRLGLKVYQSAHLVGEVQYYLIIMPQDRGYADLCDSIGPEFVALVKKIWTADEQSDQDDIRDSNLKALEYLRSITHE